MSKEEVKGAEVASASAAKPVAGCVVVVKQSLLKDAGRGVFAAKAVPKWSPVCYYDGYARPKDRKLSALEVSYTMNDTVGYMSPRTQDGVAQIINDGARVKWPVLAADDDRKSATKKALNAVVTYMIDSLDMENVTIGGDTTDGKWLFYTSANLKEGYELYYSYGPAYWYDKDCGDMSPLLARAAGHAVDMLQIAWADIEELMLKRLAERPPTSIDEILTLANTQRRLTLYAALKQCDVYYDREFANLAETSAEDLKAGKRMKVVALCKTPCPFQQ
jgi:hypothetical protein